MSASSTTAYQLFELVTAFQRDNERLLQFITSHEEEISAIHRSMVNGAMIAADGLTTAHQSEWLVVDRRLRKKLRQLQDRITTLRQQLYQHVHPLTPVADTTVLALRDWRDRLDRSISQSRVVEEIQTEQTAQQMTTLAEAKQELRRLVDGLSLAKGWIGGEAQRAHMDMIGQRSERRVEC